MCRARPILLAPGSPSVCSAKLNRAASANRNRRVQKIMCFVHFRFIVRAPLGKGKKMPGKSTREGTRTLNLPIRGRMPCPLGHAGKIILGVTTKFCLIN